MLVPLGSHLVAGQGTYANAANIPELARRMHELPGRSVPISVVGPDAPKMCETLESLGRIAVRGAAPKLSCASPALPIARLWEPHPLVTEFAITQEPGACLDLGCGSGRDSVFLASLNWNVVAVDHLPEAIAKAEDLRTRYLPTKGIYFQVADASTFEGPSVDLVCLIRCYSAELLANAIRHLKPGGRVLISAKAPPHRFSFDAAHLPGRSTILRSHISHEWTDLVIGV